MSNLSKCLNPVLVLLTLWGCSHRISISEAEINSRAQKIAASYDSTNIDLFRTWGFVNRGPNGIWYKGIGDSSLYGCIYLDYGDSTQLSILSSEQFLEDFGVNLPFDSAYWRLCFTRHSNQSLNISVNNQGHEVVLVENAQFDSIFTQRDPFQKLQQLCALRDSLQFVGVNYYKRLGGFIEFNLSPYHILTYIPSYDSLNPKFKEIWISKFEEGRFIQDNWNLRRLDKPIDNG